MKKIILTSLILLLLPSLAMAQLQGDVCHVYVLDVMKGRKAIEEYRGTSDRKAKAKTLLAAQTMFPEFKPLVGEEQLTTKTYTFPGSKLIITASVYYTDESMASSEGFDSMLLGVVVSEKSQRDAISTEGNAVAEVTDSEGRDVVRAKKYVRVSGRLYLVGIECRSKEREDRR